MRKGKSNKDSGKGASNPLRRAFAIALILIMVLPIFAESQPVGLPVLPTNLFGFALLVVFTVIAVAALVFMLAGLIDSPAARGWARFQIYEGILTIVLILIFLAFIYLFTLDPNQALQSVGLLPTSGEFNCSSAQDVFSIATCDISVFNRYAFGLFEATFFTTMFMGFTPGFGFELTLAPPGTDLQMQGGAKLASFFPIATQDALSFAFSAVLILEIINQVQSLLLAGSLMWLAFFVTLGLIARSFGFMRTFGGAMIALGLGLGLVYPLVTSITYGFVDTTLQNSLGCAPGTVGCIYASPSTIPGLGSDLMISFLFLLPAVFGSSASLPVGPWVFALGTAVAGLTFVGFLNFTIVDAFIVDFSRSIGERIDFMSLLVGLI
jgi:hypothetical protein